MGLPLLKAVTNFLILHLPHTFLPSWPLHGALCWLGFLQPITSPALGSASFLCCRHPEWSWAYVSLSFRNVVKCPDSIRWIISWNKHHSDWSHERSTEYARKIVLFVVHSPSHVQLFATPWAAACQSSLSSTISWSLLKFMCIGSVMLSNHLILCHCLLLLPSIFPTSGSFQMSQLFTSGGLSIGASASASVLPMNIQGWFPLGLAGLMSSLSKGFSRVISSTTIWKHQFFGIPLSLWNDGLCLKY